jgi:hypothetical protein
LEKTCFRFVAREVLVVDLLVIGIEVVKEAGSEEPMWFRIFVKIR